jgi:EAL domain-containing protein (putative c-di-GMP-specific phosphodiesterase class I)
VAERLQYTSNLDLAFTEKALATLEDAMQRKTPLVAMELHLNLNLSAASLLDESFMPRLLALLDKHESVAKHLLFAMNEAPALRQGKAFEAFVWPYKPAVSVSVSHPQATSWQSFRPWCQKGCGF